MAARLPVGGADVAVRITSSAELRELNRTFAGEDHTTDVLSFAGDGYHLGDIAISWPMVEEQAAAQGHGPKQELAVLLVHGFLHLLGWDHGTREERDEMSRLTELALGAHRSGYTRDEGLRRSPRA